MLSRSRMVLGVTKNKLCYKVVFCFGTEGRYFDSSTLEIPRGVKSLWHRCRVAHSRLTVQKRGDFDFSSRFETEQSNFNAEHMWRDFTNGGISRLASISSSGPERWRGSKWVRILIFLLLQNNILYCMFYHLSEYQVDIWYPNTVILSFFALRAIFVVKPPPSGWQALVGQRWPGRRRALSSPVTQGRSAV